MTPKQASFVKLLLDNIGQTGEKKTLGELLLEAGYSENIAKNPYLILESETIQEELEPFIEQLDKKVKLALKHITPDKLDKSSARDNAYVLDTLNKNKQLLSGGATERVTYSFDDYGNEESNNL